MHIIEYSFPKLQADRGCLVQQEAFLVWICWPMHWSEGQNPGFRKGRGSIYLIPRVWMASDM